VGVFGSECPVVSEFKLDSRKAIEAAAILAGKSPGRKIGRKRLLALIYIASRKCLRRSGRPLLGGRLVAMQYGPIHGDVYDLIQQREDAEGSAEWSRHFHNEGHEVVLDKDPGISALSRFEAKALTDTFEQYEGEEDFDIARETHRLQEYVVARRKGKARRISLAQLVYAVEHPSTADDLIRDLEEKAAIDELFESAKNPPAQNDNS
jgi:hypothetical protein